MKRDALPQHEIDRIAARVKAGERLEDVYLSMAATVEKGWFDRNAESLYKLAGVERPTEPAEDLDDILDEPEPSEATVAAAEPTEAELQDEIDREPQARGKKHGKR